MSRGEALDSTTAPAAHAKIAGSVNGTRERVVADILSAKAPYQDNVYVDRTDSTVAALGRRLGRVRADYTALDELDVSTSKFRDHPDAKTHDEAEGLMRSLQEQTEALIEAISYRRADTIADVLAQAVVVYDAGQFLTLGGLKDRQVDSTGERVKRLAFSIISYCTKNNDLIADDFGAHSLAPSRLDKLAPEFMLSEIANLLGREVLDSSAGAGGILRDPDAAPEGEVLRRIATHRHAANRLDDAISTIDFCRMHKVERGRRATEEREAERAAASTEETEAFNALFSVLPTSTAGLLALIRHVQGRIEDSTGNEGSITLRDLLGALGNAVEGLRATTSTASSTTSTTALSSDAFLLGLAPALVPMLDEADRLWAVGRPLYAQAHAEAGEPQGHRPLPEQQAWVKRFDEAMQATGYTAAADIANAAFERIEAMVGPLMSVPAQTLDGLLLKERIGHSLEHYRDDAAQDLAKLARARFGYAEREPRS